MNIFRIHFLVNTENIPHESESLGLLQQSLPKGQPSTTYMKNVLNLMIGHEAECPIQKLAVIDDFLQEILGHEDPFDLGTAGAVMTTRRGKLGQGRQPKAGRLLILPRKMSSKSDGSVEGN